jgi:hypothetical protein
LSISLYRWGRFNLLPYQGIIYYHIITIKQVELDEFVWVQVTLTHQQKGILVYTPDKVPSASNPTSKFAE